MSDEELSADFDRHVSIRILRNLLNRLRRLAPGVTVVYPAVEAKLQSHLFASLF